MEAGLIAIHGENKLALPEMGHTDLDVRSMFKVSEGPLGLLRSSQEPRWHCRASRKPIMLDRNSKSRFSPSELRSLLTNPNTGTSSKNRVNDKIGVMPDLLQILSNSLKLTVP